MPAELGLEELGAVTDGYVALHAGRGVHEGYQRHAHVQKALDLWLGVQQAGDTNLVQSGLACTAGKGCCRRQPVLIADNGMQVPALRSLAGDARIASPMHLASRARTCLAGGAAALERGCNIAERAVLPVRALIVEWRAPARLVVNQGEVHVTQALKVPGARRKQSHARGS